MYNFLEKAVRHEVAVTTSQSTLFRSNNFTIVMLAAHSRVIGLVRPLLKQVIHFEADFSFLQSYLRSMLAPLIEWVLSTGFDYELNPTKVCSWNCCCWCTSYHLSYAIRDRL